MKETKDVEKDQQTPFKEAGSSMAKVVKYAGTAVIIMAGMVVMVKLGKAMFKDVKDMGL